MYSVRYDCQTSHGIGETNRFFSFPLPRPKMLNCLSDDALTIITALLNGRDIGHLWLCGDSRLNYRFGSGGCVKVFRLSFDSLFPFQWPSVVRHLAHLEEFLVDETLEEPSHPEWAPRYSDLSPNLRKLDLAFQSDFGSFFSSLCTGCFPHLEELTRLNISGHSVAKNDAALLSFVDQLPFLRVVKFSQTALGASGLATLKPSQWPRQLRETNITINYRLETEFSDSLVFPEGMEELRILISAQNASSFFNAVVWPPSLVWLVLIVHDRLEPLKEDVLVSSLLRLPRGLKKIGIHAIPGGPIPFSSSLAMALPPNLTDFHFVHMRFEDTKLISLLPRSLTKVENLPFPTAETASLFPPNITELTRLIHHPDNYAYLPSGLRSIKSSELSTVPIETGKVWPKLPDSVTSMGTIDTRYLEQHPFPRELASIHFRKQSLTDAHIERFFASNITNLHLHECSISAKQLFEKMPRNLVILRLIGCNMPSMDVSNFESLPKTLRVLQLEYVALSSPNASHVFPEGLKELVIRTLTIGPLFLNLENQKFPKLKTLTLHLAMLSEGLAQRLCSSMPRRLKKFEFIVQGDRPIDITDDSLASLPRGLTYLSTNPAPQVSGKWLAKKPACLDSVWLGLEKIVL